MIQKFLLLLFICLSSTTISAQRRLIEPKNTNPNSSGLNQNFDRSTDTVSTSGKAPKAPIDLYRIISIERDTTYLDTSLTIHKDYIFNYLRRDTFGLLQFANEGQPYNVLDFGLNEFDPYPEFGFKAKHAFYMQASDIRYYSVPTPLTELYFKTTMEKGQSLDAFITLNTHERLNFSIAYKGMRSEGKFQNQLASSGNFRFTTNYHTKNNRYAMMAHFTGQDLLNFENGGIINTADFESGDSDFTDRKRLEVHFVDAESVLKGNRFFVDHTFRVNKSDGENNLYLTHRFNFEYKFFEFNQRTVNSQRLGSSYLSTNIRDKTRYNRMFNRVGAIYENKTLGQFQFYVEAFDYNYYYNRVVVNGGDVIPSSLNDNIANFGAQYAYRTGSWNGTILFSNSITEQDLSIIDAKVSYSFNDDNNVWFRYQKINKLPDHNYNLFQSSYMNYNWSNDFNNEKINNVEVAAETQWATAALQYTSLDDKLYFRNSSTTALLAEPAQYGNTINYLSLKLAKEFRFGKLALDNTVLYQKTMQDDDILNVPEFVTRNTLYYSDHVFKRAMFIQTGFTVNYFTKYYADDYNPVLGQFYVQNQKEVGAFPMIDFFVNARVKQTRIYLKAEHFNSLFGSNNYYTAPNYPYRDFMVRFGLVWNFFQ